MYVYVRIVYKPKYYIVHSFRPFLKIFMAQGRCAFYQLVGVLDTTPAIFRQGKLAFKTYILGTSEIKKQKKIHLTTTMDIDLELPNRFREVSRGKPDQLIFLLFHVAAGL